MPDTKPTPTVLDSDRAAAFKALPCLCEWPIEGQHTTPCPRVYWLEVATEIAAAREAWGAELTAELQGLREIATSGPSTATGRSPLSHRKVLDAQDHLDIMRGGGDADYAEAVAGLVEAVENYRNCQVASAFHICPTGSCDYALRAALERVKA